MNNSAIAAKYLSNDIYKVSILDIDFHHGNGTQDIFYDSDLVQYVSIHGDPNYHFPYFTGYSSEIGIGEGKGMNFNYPLSSNCTENDYLSELSKAIEVIIEFDPSFLVISLGTDINKYDKVGNFGIDPLYWKTYK